MPSRAKTTKTMNTIPSTVWAGSAEGSTVRGARDAREQQTDEQERRADKDVQVVRGVEADAKEDGTVHAGDPVRPAGQVGGLKSDGEHHLGEGEREHEEEDPERAH